VIWKEMDYNRACMVRARNGSWVWEKGLVFWGLGLCTARNGAILRWGLAHRYACTWCSLTSGNGDRKVADIEIRKWGYLYCW